MVEISIQKLAVNRIGTFDPNNPHISKIELEIIFNVDKSRLIAYQIFNAENVRIQTVRKRFYNKGETLYSVIRETSFYDPALMPREEYGADGQVRLVAWLIDGNNQRISDMATSILNITLPTPEKIEQYEQLVESLKMADPSVYGGVNVRESSERCPMYCNIVYVPTNTVAYSGLCSCSMLENYQSDPNYRIDQISKRETKPGRDVVFKEPEPEITTAGIDPYVPPTEKPFEKPDYRGTQPEPEVTTDHIEPPGVEEPEIITSQVEPSDLIDTIDTIETSQVEPPGVEEPEITTSQVEPPGQEVTAQISWFGNTWFPWHLELEDR
jgi:hypothetical protein